MVKPEWGTKRTCPKCGTRFYDLGKEDPVACIECSETWHPEPVLKSKQPIPFEEEKKKKEAEPDSDHQQEEAACHAEEVRDGRAEAEIGARGHQHRVVRSGRDGGDKGEDAERRQQLGR